MSPLQKHNALLADIRMQRSYRLYARIALEAAKYECEIEAHCRETDGYAGVAASQTCAQRIERLIKELDQ